jgi:GT2 family glycosyltransferase
MIENSFPLVSIVVLTWNQRDLTLDCLTSLSEMDYPADKLQIVVVDNGSHDNTPTAVRERFPSVVVLENGDNLGFAEGNNVGIYHALKGTAEYIMLLNNDTIVDKAMLRHLIDFAEASSDVGIVTPKIYYYDEPERIWCAGAAINWRTAGTSRLQAEETDRQSKEAPQDVDFASGCAICLKRSVVEQIGLLDDRFFIYYEETEWCVRAARVGWRIVYVPEARLWHRISSAMGVSSPATEYYMNRNVILFLLKSGRGIRVAFPLLRSLGRNLAAIAAFTVKSHNGHRIPQRNARVLALRDSLLGRWGKMGDDVARVCYPGHGHK